MIAGPSQLGGAGGEQTPAPGHSWEPVDVLSPELLPVVVVADDELDSASEAVVLDGSTLVVTPPVSTAPEELDPPLVSPLPVTCGGGEEKQPANPTHSHAQCSNLIGESIAQPRTQEAPCIASHGRRRGPRWERREG